MATETTLTGVQTRARQLIDTAIKRKKQRAVSMTSRFGQDRVVPLTCCSDQVSDVATNAQLAHASGSPSRTGA